MRTLGAEARSLPAWGVYARNVQRFSWENVRLACAQDDLRPALMAESAERLNLDSFRLTKVPGVADPLMLTHVTQVELRDVDPPKDATGR